MKKQINILIIGFGPHAKKTYASEFEKMRDKYNLQVLGLVDFSKNKKSSLDFCKNLEIAKNAEFIPVPERQLGHDFIPDTKFLEELNIFVKKSRIDAVFIATEPISHKFYVMWALSQRLHIFLDKPVTLYVNSSTDYKQAKKISEDYYEIEKLHKKCLLRGEQVIFTCLAQRRYHPAFLEMRKFVNWVFQKTHCPITSVTALHSDGQWRLPEELLNENYHGFDEGVGKISHSGYHLIDIVPWLMKAAEDTKKKINKIKIYSNFTRPTDVIKILNEQDLRAIFGKQYKQSLNEDALLQRLKNFGEVDGHINVAFMHDNAKMTNVNFTFLHNSFSARTWLDTKNDPLINKGRLKHESISIYQGPFASIQYHCFRASSKDSFCHYEMGGLLHTEAIYFINSDILGTKEAHAKRVPYFTDDPPHTLQETSRSRCVHEFIDAVENFGIKKTQMASPFEEHEASINLMSGIYSAAAQEFRNGVPFYEMPFKL